MQEVGSEWTEKKELLRKEYLSLKVALQHYEDENQGLVALYRNHAG
jgi:hypothetical protein